ncbi:Right handed beta helix region [Halomicrobium zhouii]|uniref:Right handed beta helix region n=1 Tax=Halomicrobium zhouii TaxID=767519 RepID=A0A1I6L7B6_9EURY|nr:right-handed parallel beta-helix repeat-containing protein [Halomicrobium zhouii]SFR99366.1 Right handed beta helix region [Halomicrobium zhouii]
MSRRLPQVAVLLVALAVGAAGTAVLASGPASAQATSIDSCTVIDEPGHYVLTQDVDQPGETESACIEIRSSDVVLDGDGHTVDGNGYGTGVGTAGTTAIENVSVVDLTVRESVTNVRFENVSDGQLSNVTSQGPDSTGAGVAVIDADRIEVRSSDLAGGSFGGPAIRIRDSKFLTVSNNAFTGGVRSIDAELMTQSTVSGNEFSGVDYPVDVDRGADNVISNNTIRDRPQVGIDVSGHANRVSDNTIATAGTGINVSGTQTSIENNDVSPSEEWAVTARGDDHTVVNNDLSGGDGIERSGGALRLAGGDHRVASNTLDGVHGVYIESAARSVDVQHNDIDAIYGARVAEMELCLRRQSGAAAVDVRANNFTADGGDGRTYAVLNEDDGLLAATNNYWGAENGPSSPTGENVSDPITGAAADGDGAPVSSGVHFDPWLTQEHTNQTAG